MLTVPVSDFIPSLRKIVNVPLNSLMEQNLVKAAQLFCRKSQEVVYTRELGDVIAMDGYTLISDSELNADKILFKCSLAVSVVGTDTLTQEPRFLTNTEDFTVVTRDELIFHANFSDVSVRCSIEPVQGATELPQVLYDDYLDGICSGAASTLFMQPDVDWSNANLAKHHDVLFTEALLEAKRFRLEANPKELFDRPVRTRSFY